MPAKPDIAALSRKFISALPHCNALNMELLDVDKGHAVMAMPYAEELIGDPLTGVIHSGAVSALMDSTCGAAVMSHPKSMGRTATIDLRIDYMRAATPGQRITTKATCYHVTRSVAFVRAIATDEDEENPVAAATGTFTMEGRK